MPKLSIETPEEIINRKPGQAHAVHPTQRAAILTEAAELTNGDRLRDYGEPVENHRHIARIFNSITGRDLTSRDVALLLHSVKLARLMKSPDHRDSYVDGAAYLAIAFECAEAGDA